GTGPGGAGETAAARAGRESAAPAAAASLVRGSYNRCVKIYTRTGDEGQTSYFDGTRVRKDDPRLDAYGEIDEVNAWLGFIRASRVDPDIESELEQIQRDLFALGAQLADPGEKLAPRVTKAALTDGDVVRLEALIHRLATTLPPLRHFTLPRPPHA